MAERAHYVCDLRLDGVHRYVVWYTDAKDGLLRRADGRLLAAPTQETVRAQAAAVGVRVLPELPTKYDFDALSSVLLEPPRGPAQCTVLLDAWNLLDDAILAADDGGRFQGASRAARVLYEKVCWASNPPSVKPRDKSFSRDWNVQEMEDLRSILQLGVGALRAALEKGGAPAEQ